MSGSEGGNGEPFSVMGDLLSKNILLAAYDTPQTAEELAIETGVAMPYVQERLDRLVSATLMTKTGNRYATAFYIVSEEVQKKGAALTEERTKALTEKLIGFIELETKFHEANGSIWHEGYQSYEDMKWAMLMFAVDDHCDKANDRSLYLQETDMRAAESDFSDSHTVRPNGGRWDVIGYVNCEFDRPQPAFVGMHGCNHDFEEPDNPRFWQYKFLYHNIYAFTPNFLTLAEGVALQRIARGEEMPEGHLCRRLAEYGYLRKDGEKYVPTFYVKAGKKVKPFTEAQQAELDTCSEDIKNEILALRRTFANAIIEDTPSHLLRDPRAVNFAISTAGTELRGPVLEEALRQGYLTYEDRPGEARERMLGAYLGI